jgi:hypothetical protein
MYEKPGQETTSVGWAQQAHRVLARLVLAWALSTGALTGLLLLVDPPAQAAPAAVCHWTGPADNAPRDWASIAFWDCGQIPGPGDAAVIDGYGRKININVPVTVERFALINSSSIDAYQTLTVTGAMEWDGEIVGGGHLSPTGAAETLVIAPGAVLSITNPGPDSRLLRGRLVNYGAVEHAAGKTLRLFYAVIDNRAGGVYRVSSGRIDKSNIYGSPDDGGWFDNAGALAKAGDGQFVLHAALSNSGQVTVSQDILRVEMAADVQVVTHTSAFFIDAPGTLLLAGYEHRFEAASSITGPGVLRLDGADAVVRGEYSLTGLTDLASAADLHLETPAGAVSLARLNLDNGSRLRGSNDITITQALTLSNAVAEGSTGVSDTLNIAPGAGMWINAGGGVSFRTLNNYGTVQLTRDGCFAVRNDAVFNNQPSGVFTVSQGRMDACEPFPASRNGVVNNYGRFVKLDPGDFDIDYHISLNNAGSLEIWEGALRADGPFRQTAGETFLDGGTLRNSNYHLLFDGGRLRGSGAISLFQDRWLQNNGAIIQPSGLLTLDQHYSQGVSGTLQIDIGGLTPGVGYGVFQVARQATLDGQLILSPTNNFLPTSGDFFRVMEYGSRSGEFAQVERGLGLAFGPEYQSDAVVVSDNPTLVEFSQRPDRRRMPPASASGFSLRLTNVHSETVAATFQNVLPAGFVFLDGSATSNLPLLPPSVTLDNGSQTLAWPPLEIASGAVVTIHFGVAVLQTVGAYTNTAQVAVTPTLAAPRTLRLYAQVDVSLSPTRNTLIEVTNGLAYPPSEPDGLWTIVIRRGTPSALVGVKITSTPVCTLSACGPLKSFNALHDGQIFPLTLVSGTTDRYQTEIPLGQFNLFERIFLSVVFDPPTASQRAALSTDDGAVGDKAITTKPAKVDPSGFVTDADTGAPIAGATVTLYRVAAAWPDTRNTSRDCRTVESRPGGLAGLWSSLPAAVPGLGVMEDALFAPAVIDPAINPQITDADGWYGWDVVRGCWYVKVEAAGYATRYSPLVGVPPEVTDLDIQLQPLPAPPPAYLFLPVILH